MRALVGTRLHQTATQQSHGGDVVVSSCRRTNSCWLAKSNLAVLVEVNCALNAESGNASHWHSAGDFGNANHRGPYVGLFQPVRPAGKSWGCGSKLN